MVVWQTLKTKSVAFGAYSQSAYLKILEAIAGKLMLPFWLATFGIGSFFGISAGFGIKDVVRHFELLLGPPLILSLEITGFWLIAKILNKKQSPA